MADPSRLLASLAESAVIALRGDAAAICLLDDSGTRLSVAAVYGLPAELLNLPPWEINTYTADRQALAGHAAVAVEGSVGLSGREMQSEMCAPLFHEDKSLGTLHVYARQPGRFCEKDAAQLAPVTDLGAAAIAAAGAVERLEAVESSQAQFIRVATHELRSPVTVAQSLVRNVLKGYTGSLTEVQTEVFTRISRRLDLLETLVNDLLDLAAGKAPAQAESESVLLNASIGRVMLLLQPRAEEKGIKMTVQACRDPLVVRATEEGLDRILVNIVGNAIKYTPAGGAVRVLLQAVDGPLEGQKIAQVDVTDSGIGIPEEAMPHLFEEFYRAPNAKKGSEVGTGLGLAIVHDLVERYGGQIHIRSAVGVGTTCTVTFPLVS